MLIVAKNIFLMKCDGAVQIALFWNETTPESPSACLAVTLPGRMRDAESTDDSSDMEGKERKQTQSSNSLINSNLR